ncbi:MAG: FHA domain-containing protein [Rhodanobacteraceae bacterium]
MKLIFPDREHASFALLEGITRVGTTRDCELRLDAPGMAAHHAEIEYRAGRARVRAPSDDAPVVLNGRRIDGEAVLKAGDLLRLGSVGCRVVATAEVKPRPSPGQASEIDAEDRTRIRSALPGYVLRGVSGSTFGKRFSIVGSMTVGRQSACDITVPSEEISRRHVRLSAGVDGVGVEDLGSANGTYINDKRVQIGLLKPGDELRLDTVRFLLASTAGDVRRQVAGANVLDASPPAVSVGAGYARMVVMVAIAVVVIAATVYGLLHWL